MAKQDLHMKYYDDANFICTTCDHKFVIGSTLGNEVKIDTCSNCHPFYTGKQTFANAEGRVEKFKEKIVQKEKINLKNKSQEKSKIDKQSKEKKSVFTDLSELKNINKK